MAQQSSRLHRLLTLLDTGSTQATRFTAARQIGDIAKSYPQDLNSLLSKVSQFLHSKNWDTRVAAAHAIGAIAESVKHASLADLRTRVETKMLEEGISGLADKVVAWSSYHPNFTKAASFRSYELNKVLEFGALLASGGQEYEIANDNTKNPRERLARQKQNLKRRLGLDVCEQFMDVNDMIRDEDLIVQKAHFPANDLASQYHRPRSMHNVKQLVTNMVPSFRSRRPSARELNLLKRKAKINLKDQAKVWTKEADTEDLHTQEVASPKGLAPDFSTRNKVSTDSVTDDEGVEEDGDEAWPFHSFVEQLILDMFDPVWEVRHGSVMALREILTHQGASVGVSIPNLSDDGPILSESQDTCTKSTSKREREIDLNLQAAADEYVLTPKRPKLEDSSSQLLDAMISSSSNGFSEDCIKVEANGMNLGAPQADGELGIGSVEVEVEPYIDNSGFLSEAVDVEKEKNFPEDKVIIEKTDILNVIPENCELTKLVKLARHSWLKNSEFLQDCAVRFLCVLSLDRFGDYVSDQVVAPVRETCAQALGAVFKYMHPKLVHETLNILLQMQCRPEWEIRHGSLLGIKYLVAVRQDIALYMFENCGKKWGTFFDKLNWNLDKVAAGTLLYPFHVIIFMMLMSQEMLLDLLDYVLPACKAGLEDPDDDVRAVAADALIPTAAAITSIKGQTLHSIVMLLWDILLDLDDLSPSTSSVMNLLAEIYSQDQMMVSKEQQEFDLNEAFCVDDTAEGMNSKENPFMLSMLAPRLWPFMRHSIMSVRHSAIRTLERLLEAGYRRSMSMSTSSFWPSFILGDTLRIVFQNMLLESSDEILECSERVWRLLLQCPVEDLDAAAKMYISSWIELAATPYGSSIDASKMFWPVVIPRKSHFRAAAKMRAVNLEFDVSKNMAVGSAEVSTSQEKNGDVSISPLKIIVGADVEMSVTHTRVVTATAIGILASKLYEISASYIVEPLWKTITSTSGVQRQVASMVVISWFKEIKTRSLSDIKGAGHDLFINLKSWLLDLLACTDPAFPTKDSLLPYAELSRTYAKMRNEANQLFVVVESCGMHKDFLSSIKLNLESLTADDAINFASSIPPVTDNDSAGEDSVERHIADDWESLKQRLLTTSGYLKCVQGNLHVTVCALVAAAVVHMSDLPSKLNPVILPLMASVKREQEEILQDKAAEALTELIHHCTARKPSPNDKLIRNLCNLTCTDPRETPQAGLLSSQEIVEDLDPIGTSSSKQKSKSQMLASGEDRSKEEGFLSRRGSELALKHLCKKFGSTLFDKLPKLWDCLTEILKPCSLEWPTSADEHIIQSIDHVNDPQSLINNVQMIRSISPFLDESIRPKLLMLLPSIFRCVRHSDVSVRLAASRCITSMAKSMTVNVMGAIIENVIPMLGDMTSVHARQGAGMLINRLVPGLGMELVPYASLLVVPLLRCMSDCDHTVRQSVTHSFAALVPLLPLARGLSPPVGLSEGLSRNAEDAKFLEQLVDNSHIEDYKLATNLKVTLRRYQQEGINWLAFLKRFNLHGILCDDMGLGKTLQASAIVASDIAEHRGADDSVYPSSSLIICPSTLVGHWVFEIEKFIDASVITTLQYVGSVQDRASLRSQFNKYNVIVTSYDVVRKDIDNLKQFLWNYCILDEGHIIKNSKSKITGAVKQLKAQHRLILSGTPIQNNVLDLWSLFDFLMPGFLGTDRQFQATYGKPLLAARDSKCSAKDAEAGALAMEALHKQVMPFLLRRTKDEVLSDLPEKIIQDRYCDLSHVQLKLYEQFSGSQAKQEITSIVKVNEVDQGEGIASSKASTHVFQALQFLLKLCSHPLLVVGEKTPDALVQLLPDIFPAGTDIASELHKLHHSPKLVALQQILEECGIGLEASSSEGSVTVGQHRVLIFAQHKAFLDIIEKDLFHARMKTITYLRLDGSVEPEKRFDIVKAFNSDPTIDALLLTTHVGGLGLNLTSADTLVFMEHDWNPMRDHQAMDRAHRLGQRKVVNVHRLIMRGTLEEKVMSLQKFKLSVANAIINADNASLKTMNTDQLLDLFASADSKKGANISKTSDVNIDGEPKLPGGGKGLKAILGGLEELWDQSQYTEEYNLNHFLARLNG